MFSKVLVLVAASVLACEAKIEIPGLEDLPKCARHEEPCIIANSDRINKAISKPFPGYSIKGYDPISIDELTVDKRVYEVTQHFSDLEITGLGDTKTISGKLEGEDGAKKVTVTYEHNLKFSGKGKAVFHIQPELTREGPISGEFVGIRTQFSYPVKKVEKDGERYLELGQETLLSVEMPNLPVYNEEQFASFVSAPETADIVKKIKENRLDYHKGLAVGIIEKVSSQFFEDKRNFYKHVPLSDLMKKD